MKKYINGAISGTIAGVRSFLFLIFGNNGVYICFYFLGSSRNFDQCSKF